MIISGPSGSGKSTLFKMLDEKFPERFSFCVSRIKWLYFMWNYLDTTREPRNGEKCGRDYFFIDKKAFEQKIGINDFLEYAKFGSNYYGTRYFVIKLLFIEMLVKNHSIKW